MLQVLPLYPGAHLQENPLTSSMQVPPFKHSVPTQSLIS